jgi:uncharacterized integral membrane protein
MSAWWRFASAERYGAGVSDPETTRPPAPASTPPAPGRKPARPGGMRSLVAKENRRLVLGVVIGALVAVFAVLNVDQVNVNWILGSFDTPLIVVIAVSFFLGALLGWIAGAARRRH